MEDSDYLASSADGISSDPYRNNCMELFFCNAIDDNPVMLGPDESWHLSKVLRLRVGDAVAVTDGHGGFGTGEIMDINPKAALIRLKEVRQAYNQRPTPCTSRSPHKNIDRLEWFLEKATEIGIAAISPIRCQRSERKDVRIDRLEKSRNGCSEAIAASLFAADTSDGKSFKIPGIQPCGSTIRLHYKSDA